MEKSESTPPPKRAPRRRPRYVPVKCPHCKTNFRAPLKDEGYEIECLVCEKWVEVPGREELSGPPEEPEEPDGKKRRKRDHPTVFDRLAERRVVRRGDRVPKWALLSGVVSFPWYPQTLSRWIWLSVGCTLVGLLLMTILWCLGMGGFMYRAAYALCFPFFWISIWTTSFAASCWLCIIGDTAAGNDRVEDWPESHWIDWAVDLLRLLALAAPIAAVGYLVGMAFGDRRWDLLPWMGGALFLFFPPLFLSAAESGTVLALPTPKVLQSFARAWWAWLMFYGVSAGLALAWPGLLVFLLEEVPEAKFEATAITGPLAAAILLMYPRLLGRLALQIDRVM